jgi:Putative phage serine protease XkdF
MEFERTVAIAKVDEEQRIVWGWAYVSEEAGQQVVDHSEEIIESAEVQKMAHGFIESSRAGGVSHTEGVSGGRIVDSVFFSPEVQAALGISLGKVGWFIGYRVDDDDAWEGVKAGKYRAFSIGGYCDVEALSDAQA